jgi:hypothetical protein
VHPDVIGIVPVDATNDGDEARFARVEMRLRKRIFVSAAAWLTAVRVELPGRHDPGTGAGRRRRARQPAEWPAPGALVYSIFRRDRQDPPIGNPVHLNMLLNGFDGRVLAQHMQEAFATQSGADPTEAAESDTGVT